jgi:acetate kinase
MSSIAVINAGSSSIKFAVFRAASTPSLLLRGQIEGIGTTPRAKLWDPRGSPLVEESFEDKNFDHAAATQAMMRIGAQGLGGLDISAVGHRVVHGEPNIRRHCA